MDHQRKTIKRLIGLPGDWVSLPEKEEVRKIPEGHCWVEGDNGGVSRDSRAYGPVRNKFYRSLGNFHLILSRHLDRQNCNQVSPTIRGVHDFQVHAKAIPCNVWCYQTSAAAASLIAVCVCD